MDVKDNFGGFTNFMEDGLKDSELFDDKVWNLKRKFFGKEFTFGRWQDLGKNSGSNCCFCLRIISGDEKCLNEGWSDEKFENWICGDCYEKYMRE